MDDEPLPTELFNSVGTALVWWSAVELNLCSLFSCIADMKSADRAKAMFDSIISFEIRLALVSNLMATEDVDPIEAEMWRRLSRKLSAKYKKRHEVAHFSLRQQGQDFYAAPFLTLTKLWSDEETRLSADEIKKRAEQFTMLARAITWFNIRAVHRRARSETNQPTPPQEDPFVVQLRELAIQSLAEKKSRAQSSQV